MNAEDRILDRYRLTERLAVGGSAEVWRATDEQLDRPVAVKLLHPHLLPDSRSRRRLSAEARAAAGLSHPGVVGIYDVDAQGEAPALVMELVDGESLATRIQRDGALPPDEAARITADVADALFHAHQRGIVHRDIKPGNILLERDGRARLVDFGIAHSLAASAERLTLTGTVLGTLHYMAPEQLAGGPIGPRTDLYGVGTVLYEALTGRPPFSATTPVALVEEQRAGPPSMDGVDRALAGVIAACLAVDPAQRPLHAGALAAALRAWWHGDPGPALAMAPLGDVDRDAVTQQVMAAAPVQPVAAVAAPPPAAEPTAALRAAVPTPLLAALAAAALVGLLALALGGGMPRTIGADPSPSQTPASTAAPTGFDLGSLPAPVRKVVQEYLDVCQQDQPPVDVSGMNKHEAEDALQPLIEECKARREGEGD